MSTTSHQYRFCLHPTQSPTYHNLHHYLQEKKWIRSTCIEESDFNELNFEFNLEAAESLEFKHLLASLVQKLCVGAMPATYCIDDCNWMSVLGQLEKVSTQRTYGEEPLVWILKPSLLNNGKHIKIFQQLSDLKNHYLSANRLGGEHVLQQYLTKPHLLNGHKYSIRMFVVITNYAGAYLYPDGYLNVAKYVYQPTGFDDLRSHLTNEHLRHDESNVTQVPTKPIPGFIYIYQQIKRIVSAVIKGLKQLYPQAFVAEERRTLAIFGFDFIVDSDLRAWLLEANHGPCFPCNADHPLQHRLYDEFWQAFITSFVEPIASKSQVQQIGYQTFELV